MCSNSRRVAAAIGGDLCGDGFRGLYHCGRPCLSDDTTQLIPFYIEHQKLLGLVKAKRQRQRQKDALWTEIWENVPGCCPAVLGQDS